MQGDWQILKTLLPYLKRYTGRIVFALLLMMFAKFMGVGVQILLKHVVDGLSSVKQMLGLAQAQHSYVLVLGSGLGLLIVAHSIMCLLGVLFAELKGILFSKVTYNVLRTVALQVFDHLHNSL